MARTGTNTLMNININAYKYGQPHRFDNKRCLDGKLCIITNIQKPQDPAAIKMHLGAKFCVSSSVGIAPLKTPLYSERGKEPC